jgi:hypothetical protein
MGDDAGGPYYQGATLDRLLHSIDHRALSRI